MKKVPMRKCIVTGEILEKNQLIRVVRNKEGEVFIDPTGKMYGRGAYLKKDIAVFEKAEKNKCLNKILEVEVPNSIFEQLKNLVK